MLPLLLGSFIISFSAVFVELSHLPPTASAFHRVFFGGLALLALQLVRNRGRLRFEGGLALNLATALAFALDLLCWHRAIGLLGPGLATLLGNFQVLILALISLVFLKERLGARFWLALPLALSGVACITGLSPSAYTPEVRLGIVYGLLTSLFYAAFILGLRRMLSRAGGHDPLAVQTTATVASAVLLLAGAVAQDTPLSLPTAREFWLMAGYGVFCQALGWLCISRGLARMKAALAGLVILAQPALSFLWDVLFFGRAFGPTEMAGAALALAGIYLGSTSRADGGRAGPPDAQPPCPAGNRSEASQIPR